MNLEEGFEGKMIIFTAPSGAGKTTLVNHLLEKYDFLGFSVSATTRARRDHEVEGKNYYFLSPETFQQYIDEGRFLEWEEVYKDQYYGSLWSEVERNWEEKKHIIFDIDVKGALKLKEKYGDKCLAIFVKPPSIKTLINRLTSRGTEDAHSLRKRITRVKNEMTYENRFDDIIVNDSLDTAKKDAELKLELFLFDTLLDN